MASTQVETGELEFTGFATAITPRLFRTALLMCGDWHLAEDLVQTTLAKLFVHWGKVERADLPEAYARGVLTKTFLSHKRVRRNAELPSVDLGADRAAPASPDRLELFEALRTARQPRSCRDRPAVLGGPHRRHRPRPRSA